MKLSALYTGRSAEGVCNVVKMLIVDDEIEICDFLKNFFTEKDYDVNIAISGEEALEKIKKNRPKVLLLDIRMPGLSGLDVLKQAHQMDKDLRIIMITAVENQDMMQLARKLGASDYITKPFSLNYLETNVFEKVSSLPIA